jgi:hypothetical protein
MEEGGLKMFAFLKQNKTNYNFLKVCPENMCFLWLKVKMESEINDI